MKRPIATRIYPLTDDPQPHVARDTLYSAPDRPLIVGKSDEEERPLLNRHGELDPDKIARAIAARIGRQIEIPSVQARVAYLEAKQRPTIAPISLPVVPTGTRPSMPPLSW